MQNYNEYKIEARCSEATITWRKRDDGYIRARIENIDGEGDWLTDETMIDDYILLFQKAKEQLNLLKSPRL